MSDAASDGMYSEMRDSMKRDLINTLYEKIKKIELSEEDKEEIQRLEQTPNEIANRVRDYNKSQVTNWRKIPYLALKSSIPRKEIYVNCERFEVNDKELELAYKNGLWTLKDGKNHNNKVYIDLESGKIIDSTIFQSDKRLHEASNKLVLENILDLTRVPAIKIVRRLEAKFDPWTVVQSYKTFTIEQYRKAESQIKEWQENEAERYNVNKKYIRT